MDVDSPCRLLAEAIEKGLRRRISVSADIMHYMASVSGLVTLESIQKTLLDETSCESASFFELVLFPDEGFQIAIEALVEDCHCSNADEKTICDIIMTRKIDKILVFPGLGSAPVTLPAETIPIVIARLNLTRTTDPRIIGALRRFTEEPLRTRCKIRLRNSRWIQSEPHILLLQEVIEKTAFQTGNFIEILDVLLEFLSGPHPESDMIQALISEKERLIHLLDMAERQDQLLRTSPMEAIMLQGVRILSIDRENIITRIRILDQILR